MNELRTQSRLASFIEAIANTGIGFFISMVASAWFLPVMGVKITHTQLWWYTWFMTIISVARGYVLRRMWNAEWWKHAKAWLDKRARDRVWKQMAKQYENDYVISQEFEDEGKRRAWLQGEWEVTDDDLRKQYAKDPERLAREVAGLSHEDKLRLNEKLRQRGIPV